jgi:acyl carrier protein
MFEVNRFKAGGEAGLDVLLQINPDMVGLSIGCWRNFRHGMVFLLTRMGPWHLTSGVKASQQSPGKNWAPLQFNLVIHLSEEANMADTYEEVQGIIVELLGVDEGDITMDAKFREDLEADSLDLVELIMAFEEKFGGEISDEDAQKITTVGEAVDYINQNLQ